MSIKDIFKQMNSGELRAHSELGSRDESKQTRTYSARFSKLPTATGIKAHALVMKDLVVKFNPFTCERDDMYNEKTPFRPILLVSQSIAGIKEVCSSNPELAEKWNKALGTELDWSSPVTLEDYYAFKAAGMIKPRIMSYATVSINFNGACGFSTFRHKYTIDPTKLNENFSYDNNPPIEHQAAIFFHAILRPEWEETKAALEKSHANKETITSQRQTVFSKSPIGFPTPTNLVPFIYLPIDESIADVKADDFTSFEQLIRFTGYSSDKWQTAMTEVRESNVSDDNIDFYDFTITTPAKTATKNDGKVYTDEDYLDIYKAMTITVTDARRSAWTGNSTIDQKSIKNSDLYKNVFAAAESYFLYSQEQSGVAGGDTFEKLMAASNGFRSIESIKDRFLEACMSVFKTTFEGSKYFTKEVREANSSFYIAMNPDHALALADSDKEDLDAAEQKQSQEFAAIMGEIREDMKSESDADVLDLDGMKIAED